MTEKQAESEIRNAYIWQDTGFFTRDDGAVMNPDSITDWLNKFSKANELSHADIFSVLRQA